MIIRRHRRKSRERTVRSTAISVEGLRADKKCMCIAGIARTPYYIRYDRSLAFLASLGHDCTCSKLSQPLPSPQSLIVLAQLHELTGRGYESITTFPVAAKVV